MKYTIPFILALFSITFTNCDSTVDPLSNDQTCGNEIIIDTNYDTTIGDDFDIQNAIREGNCLTVSVQYGGGCGEELVSFELLGSTASFPYSLPAMLEMKIIMDDNDHCEALITRDIYFDLTPLEDEGFNNMNMTLEDWDGILQYSFE